MPDVIVLEVTDNAGNSLASGGVGGQRFGVAGVRVRVSSEPPSGVDVLTPSDSVDVTGVRDGSGTGAGPWASPYRAMRFDVSGTIKIDVASPRGTNGRATIARNVQAGEILLYPVLRIWSTGTGAVNAGGTVDALY